MLALFLIVHLCSRIHTEYQMYQFQNSTVVTIKLHHAVCIYANICCDRSITLPNLVTARSLPQMVTAMSLAKLVTSSLLKMVTARVSLKLVTASKCIV